MTRIFEADPSDRVQVFMDGPNLYGTQRAIGKKIDYKAFIDTMREETRFVRAKYFSVLRQRSETEQIYKMLDFLEFNGYTVETKSVRENIDPLHGHMRIKGTMIGEMTAQMINAADNGTDHIVLFSGDGELCAAVEACKQRDALVTVVSSEEAGVLSEDLRRACDQFYAIERLPEHILRPSTEVFQKAS